MGNGIRSKRKGYRFEKGLERVLNQLFPNGKFYRVVLSGAAGSSTGIEDLKGDVRGYPFEDIKHLVLSFEAKTGYGGRNQITLKRPWIIQAKKGAGNSAIPILALKFNGDRNENAIICMDIKDFARLLSLLYEERKKVERILEECCDEQ